MKIETIGGEFALIDRLTGIIPTDHTDLIVGVGDDAAVIRTHPEPAPYLLVTTDILVEDRHFSTRWAEPRQVGIKAAECNISDIAAMGGQPSFMFISLVLTKETEVSWPENFYKGIADSCRRHGVIVAGGDTTMGKVKTINITQLGSVTQDCLCLRSHARPGDHLMVTGPLGASAAALCLLERGLSPSPVLLQKHLAPRCRMDVAGTIAPVANAMIDISDGLASEVRHICHHSNVDALVDAESIPISSEVREAAEMAGQPPLEFALGGGEDFELLFSIAEDQLPSLAKTGVAFHKVGTVTVQKDGPQLVTRQGQSPLSGGFDHFKRNK